MSPRCSRSISRRTRRTTSKSSVRISVHTVLTSKSSVRISRLILCNPYQKFYFLGGFTLFFLGRWQDRVHEILTNFNPTPQTEQDVLFIARFLEASTCIQVNFPALSGIVVVQTVIKRIKQPLFLCGEGRCVARRPQTGTGYDEVGQTRRCLLPQRCGSSSGGSDLPPRH